jgi:YidC/Oxa1 family membrane protein insertase
VLLVLYVGSQVVSTLVATATADPNQRRMMLILPLVFVFIVIGFPAGLLVYWITTNLWTIGQQLLIRRLIPPPPKPPAKGSKADASGSENGKADARAAPALKGEPALAGVGGERSSAPPPPRSPRKKKKRSGRRR